MEYMVLSDWTPDRLVELVNNALEDGWELQGGVCFAATSHSALGYGHRVDGRFYQAMVRKK